jgi:hypothetical protein
MVTVTLIPTRHLVIGDTRHAVAAYAERLSCESDGVTSKARTFAQLHTLVGTLSASVPVHVQFTDRLFGSTPAQAAAAIERLAARSPATATLHDVPQPSDGEAFAERVECYRRVVRATRAVVCNSHYEARLLEQYTMPLALDQVVVIPLPVDRVPAGSFSGPDARAERRPEVAVLGYFYPGKGHAEVAQAVAGLGLDATVVALGRASAGHEAELAQAIDGAKRRGVTVKATGYLSEKELRRRCREVAVPIAAHRHFSASASINTWISCGRRPLVPDTAYTREMAELRPGTVTLYDEALMPDAIERAWLEPATTWLPPTAVTRPDTAEVADLYRAWLEHAS